MKAEEVTTEQVRLMVPLHGYITRAARAYFL